MKTIEIPDDVQEFVEKMHKDQRESRPDEGWHVMPAKTDDPIAPYKRDEEEVATDMDLLGDTTMAAPGTEAPMAQGQEIPGYAEGGEVPDDNLMKFLEPPGAGILAPSALPPGPAAPMAPPPAVADTAEPAAPAPLAAPAAPEPLPTDQTYMDRANKMMGLDAQEQAAFMKLLGSNAQKGQIGAAIAGIGDAIASGGTLGKVNPGALKLSEDLIQNKTKSGIEGMQQIRDNQGKAQELGDKLQARDPKSPLSKWAQKAYAGVGKKIGLDLTNASAAMISDVAGKGVDALNTEYQNQLKLMGLNLQKQQIDATVAGRNADREVSIAGRRSEAGKALANRSTLQAVAGAIPGTAANAAKHTLEDEMNLGKGPMKVNTMEEYKALPAGTHYVDSYGTEKVKK